MKMGTEAQRHKGTEWNGFSALCLNATEGEEKQIEKDET